MLLINEWRGGGRGKEEGEKMGGGRKGREEGEDEREGRGKEEIRVEEGGKENLWKEIALLNKVCSCSN